MNTVPDFEDLLVVLERHEARYLVIDDPRHRRDVRDLERVRALRARESRRRSPARPDALSRRGRG